MSTRLRYRMESVGGEPVSLTAFARLTSEMTQLLSELDRARSPQASVDWIITDLEIGSAIVEVEGHTLTPVADTSPVIVREALLALERATTGQAKPDVPKAAWRHALGIAEIVRERSTTVHLVGDGRELRLAPRPLPLPPLSPAPGPDLTRSVSTIEGSLDTVYLHEADQLHLDLWDAIYGRRVRVEFRPELLHQVRDGLGMRVRVNGLVEFDREGHPRSVTQVQSIRVLGVGHIPSPRELRGLARGLTRGLGAAEWVRRLRDAED